MNELERQIADLQRQIRMQQVETITEQMSQSPRKVTAPVEIEFTPEEPVQLIKETPIVEVEEVIEASPVFHQAVPVVQEEAPM